MPAFLSLAKLLERAILKSVLSVCRTIYTRNLRLRGARYRKKILYYPIDDVSGFLKSNNLFLQFRVLRPTSTLNSSTPCRNQKFDQ